MLYDLRTTTTEINLAIKRAYESAARLNQQACFTPNETVRSIGWSGHLAFEDAAKASAELGLGLWKICTELVRRSHANLNLARE